MTESDYEKYHYLAEFEEQTKDMSKDEKRLMGVEIYLKTIISRMTIIGVGFGLLTIAVHIFN